MTIRKETGLLYTNCYFHVYGGEKGTQRAVVIDPAQNGRMLAERLLERGIEPSGIAFTHGHLDHTAGAAEFIAFYKERGIELRCAIHGDDADYIGKAGFEKNRELFSGTGGEDVFKALIAQLPEADILLKDGDKLFDSDLRVLHTPGHSRGSICLVSGSDRLVYSGDTLFLMGVGRTDMPDGSQGLLESSLMRLFATVPDEYECFPGHGSKTTLKAERQVLYP